MNIIINRDNIKLSNYWCIDGNYWCKSIYTYGKALELAATMVNCTNCFDCRNCTGCTKCFNCNDCYDCYDGDDCNNCTGLMYGNNHANVRPNNVHDYTVRNDSGFLIYGRNTGLLNYLLGYIK